MTVRANKPAFSIREKLKELQKPIGLKGSELMRAETAQDARDLVSAGRKNLIINGAMNVNQRATNITDISDGDFVLDRHKLYAAPSNSASSTFNVSSSTEAPVGFTNSLKFEVDGAAAIPAAGYVGFDHTIEGLNTAHLSYGSANAKTITASFWCRSSKPGVFSYTIRNSAFNRTFTREFTINAVDTWEYKTLTFPGCTDGTWLTTNGVGQRHTIVIDGGTNFSGTPNIWNTSNLFVTSGMTNTWADTSGNTFYITGWQVEVGKNATEFEHRSYGEELALCQRYYWNATTTTTGATRGWMGMSYGANTYYIPVQFPVRMRTIPTVGGGGNWRTRTNNLNNLITVTWSLQGNGGEDGCTISTSGGSITAATPFWIEQGSLNNGTLNFSAEL